MSDDAIRDTSNDGSAPAPLESLLRRQIEVDGPLTVAQYMSLCLQHPEHGYYARHDPLGKAGDFTTAPEISQLFGEMLGLWLVQCWIEAGRPEVFRLIEAGPGRGTLMADILRTARVAPGFARAARLTLVESNRDLRRLQAERLAPFAEELAEGPGWAAGLEDALAVHGGSAASEVRLPLFLVANEFVDALPVRQLIFLDGAWRERLVGLGGDGRLTFAAARDPLPALPDGLPAVANDGTIAEVNPLGRAAAAAIGARLARTGGAALLVDYGGEGPHTGDTLQAVKAHAPHPVLEAPGTADLTAHVDFAALADAARRAGATVWPLLTQGRFLMRLGLGVRAEKLAASQPDAASAIAAALHRLAGPEDMGRLFKALALTAPVAGPGGKVLTGPPPAFDTPDPDLAAERV